jgi:hypothetical protein
MCFMLYAGTTRPILRAEFGYDSAKLSVESLSQGDAGIAKYFGSPEVQYIGSSSGCGCDFPFATFQNGGWPEIEFRKTAEKDALDIERDTICRRNCKALASLLRSTGETEVELYGVWNGNPLLAPQAHETIGVDTLQTADFYFKEQALYKVSL